MRYGTICEDMNKYEDRYKKQRLKRTFIESRRQFDKYVQRAKRNNWRQQRSELTSICKDKNEFLKRICMVRAGNERHKSIQMEVV